MTKRVKGAPAPSDENIYHCFNKVNGDFEYYYSKNEANLWLKTICEDSPDTTPNDVIIIEGGTEVFPEQTLLLYLP